MATGVQVVFDCADPARLARFWAEALGYRLQDPPEGYGSWEDWLRDQIGLGATRQRAAEELGGYWVVMQDPEGNEFCVH